jgi:hypothetical protein
MMQFEHGDMSKQVSEDVVELMHPVKEVAPNDMHILLQPEKYIKMPRENVISKAEPSVLVPGSATHFFIKNRGRGNDYHDFRDTYLSYDMIGTNITQEISEVVEWRMTGSNGVESVAALSNGFMKIKVGKYYVQNLFLGSTDHFNTDFDFGTLCNLIRDQILNVYYPGIIITNQTPGGNFHTSISWRIAISGFDDQADELITDILSEFNADFITIESVGISSNMGTNFNLTPIKYVITPGQLSYPRLIYGGIAPYERVYMKIGANFPTVDNANILNNLIVKQEDVSYDDSFRISRSQSRFGISLKYYRRFSTPLYVLPAVNQLILPSFVNDQFELHLESEKEDRVLIRSANNQSYQITNIELNYYLLKVPKEIDDMLYQKALLGNLRIMYNGYQTITSPIPAGVLQFEQAITYSYKSMEKLFAVMIKNSVLNDPNNVDRMNSFSRNGLSQARFQTSSGYTYPREALKSIGVNGGDIAQFQTEYLRTINLPLTRRKFEVALRSTARALLNYIGDRPVFVNILGYFVPESFILGINTNYNSSDIKSVPVICDSSVSTEGGSGSRLFLDRLNTTEAVTLFTFLFFCGEIEIDSQMNVRITQ